MFHPRPSFVSALALALAAPAACAPASAPAVARSPARVPSLAPSLTPPPSHADSATLVESAPLETPLDHPDIPNASALWLEMIRGARASLDLAEFYVSDAPQSRLSAVLDEVERAADRGVHVRLLVDESFYGKYPDSVERLARRANIETRRFDVHATMGGILHAKYFVVDRRDAFVGSQNFDWRALEHIQEMGVRLQSPALAAELDDLFAADWALAAAGSSGGAGARWFGPDWHGTIATRTADGATLRLGASPRGYLPDDRMWDLPAIVAWIDGAVRDVDVQLLTYDAAMRDGTPFRDLDDALRRAASRGVCVRLLVSHWGAKSPALARLARELPPPSAVRIFTIPKWSGGDVPFARVAHAKYAVFDGARAWVGTSNWEGDYFLRSRNVSVFVEGAPLAARLQRVFDEDWTSAYAAPLGAPSPAQSYLAPKTSSPAVEMNAFRMMIASDELTTARVVAQPTPSLPPNVDRPQ